MPVVNKNNQTISFLDTEVIGNPSGNVTVAVFRKNTHTDKYLSFESHCHVNIKKAVVKTLLDRAKHIPSTADLQTQETNKFLKTLELNGYKRNFIERIDFQRQ